MTDSKRLTPEAQAKLDEYRPKRGPDSIAQGFAARGDECAGFPVKPIDAPDNLQRAQRYLSQMARELKAANEALERAEHDFNLAVQWVENEEAKARL